LRRIALYDRHSITLKEIKGGTKSGVFDRVVGLEDDPHRSSGRLHGSRMTASAEASEQRGKSVRTVAQFHVVVGTVVGLLDVKLAAEVDTDAMSRRRCGRNRQHERVTPDNG